ncbi:hypothetical protein [Paraglaciecola sp. T6c]|uniref:hypothetical protein n=1 Tax=Pseudoalteromonas atlantica (strain T6c / ATCC BAA-1087) TaxID=3042615 RepID=UPI0003157820|nr:hypothetical protein [Paraglaciecola sp. T6c]
MPIFLQGSYFGGLFFRELFFRGEYCDVWAVGVPVKLTAFSYELHVALRISHAFVGGITHKNSLK